MQPAKGFWENINKSTGYSRKGELYAVPKDKLSEIDIYEAEGSLYKRKRRVNLGKCKTSLIKLKRS